MRVRHWSDEWPEMASKKEGILNAVVDSLPDLLALSPTPGLVVTVIALELSERLSRGGSG